jgi:hypothetical protein
MDNRHWSYGCPALMQDGRHLTNHVKFNVFDQYIRTLNEIDSAHTYRTFLQQNGDQILNKERAALTKLNTCSVTGQCLPLSGAGNQNTLPCKTCNTK